VEFVPNGENVDVTPPPAPVPPAAAPPASSAP
jgi:hypothetical protein